MRKICFVVTLVIAVVFAFSGCIVVLSEKTIEKGKEEVVNFVGGEFKYTLINEEEYRIVGFSNYTGLAVIVPDTYNGLPVTQIGVETFKDTGVKNIVIGTNVKKIERFAFQNCESLQSVTFKNPYGWYRVREDEKCALDASVVSSATNVIILLKEYVDWDLTKE